jgi:ubiquinone/menaquinone biosynthesis C-methylase UbiE
MSTNIDYWEQVVKNPPPAYEDLFQKEKDYLRTHVRPNSKVLDIGCGNGRNILSIVDIAKNITGLDNSQKAVQYTKDNLKIYPNVEVVLGDALNLPFEDSSFDFVLLSMTLVNFADGKLKALQEMKRVVKDEGKVIISVYSEKALPDRIAMYNQIGTKIKDEKDGYVTFEIEGLTSEQFTREQLEDLANKAGLKMTHCEEAGVLAYVCTLERM